MNKTAIVSVLLVAGIGAVTYSLWRSEPPAGAVPGAAEVSPAPNTPVTNREPAAPAAQMAAKAPAREHAPQNVTEPINDGDQHETAQRPTQPLENPPPPREAFGADPAGETAALQEARAMLDALERESDPATKAEIAKLRESIDATR
jgi:hypothetical protein